MFFKPKIAITYHRAVRKEFDDHMLLHYRFNMGGIDYRNFDADTFGIAGNWRPLSNVL